MYISQNPVAVVCGRATVAIAQTYQCMEETNNGCLQKFQTQTSHNLDILQSHQKSGIFRVEYHIGNGKSVNLQMHSHVDLPQWRRTVLLIACNEDEIDSYTVHLGFHLLAGVHYILGGSAETPESHSTFIHPAAVEHHLQVQCEQYGAQGVLPHLPCKWSSEKNYQKRCAPQRKQCFLHR